jgi:hypothetical protein
MTGKDWDLYIRTEGFKEYHIIECYQYIANESERKKVIRQIEACRTPDEAKAVIERVRAA